MPALEVIVTNSGWLPLTFGASGWFALGGRFSCSSAGRSCALVVVRNFPQPLLRGENWHQLVALGDVSCSPPAGHRSGLVQTSLAYLLFFITNRRDGVRKEQRVDRVDEPAS